MSKTKYVLFKGNDATVFTNQRPLIVKKNEVLLVNPDLSRVQNTSPHYWKLVDGNLVFPMNAAERTLKHATHRGHYRNLKGFSFAKLMRRALVVCASLVLGGLIIYVLMKQGRIK